MGLLWNPCTKAACVVLLTAAIALVSQEVLLPVPSHNLPYAAYHGAILRPLIVAHRGSRSMNPENTFQSHQMALELGADVLETDVRRTSDGELVMVHDPDGTRCFGRTDTFIERTTYADLQKIDAGYLFTPDSGEGAHVAYPERGKGHRVPTLGEFLDRFASAAISLEIKENDNRVAEQMWDEIKVRVGMHERLSVGARYCSVLQHFRAISGGRIATSACETEGIIHLVLVKTRLAALVYWLKPPAFSLLQIPAQSGGLVLAAEDMISISHALGLHVQFWIINDAKVMESLYVMGADGIVTDRPDRAALVLEELGAAGKLPIPSRIGRGVRGSRQWTFKRPALPASPTPYHVPKHEKNDVHTCVTPVCFVAQRFGLVSIVVVVYHVALTILFGMAHVIGCVRKRGEGKHKKKLHEKKE